MAVDVPKGSDGDTRVIISISKVPAETTYYPHYDGTG